LRGPRAEDDPELLSGLDAGLGSVLGPFDFPD
jgi:hypothetical protein